jgi:hypothetical protein
MTRRIRLALDDRLWGFGGFPVFLLFKSLKSPPVLAFIGWTPIIKSASKLGVSSAVVDLGKPSDRIEFIETILLPMKTKFEY